MTELNPDDRRDVCSALITMASISSSYKVESTKAIIKLWDDIRANIPIKDEIDNVAVVLSLGRIVDLQADQINIEDLQEVVNSFRSKMEDRNISQGTLADLGAAYLTMASVSHSHEIESTVSIVNLWDEVRKSIPLNDQLDLASTILATGRIMDLRIDVKSSEILMEIVQNIKKEMESSGLTQVDYKEQAILLLAAAFVELSPKVETYRDIVKSWLELRNIISVSTINDIVALILFSGKVRDMDTSMFMHPSSLTDQIKYITSAMDKP